MTSLRARQFLLGAGALVLGAVVTATGFALQNRQMSLVVQTHSVRPVLDSTRNAEISLCLPVLAVADRVADYGFPAFLMLSLLNVAVWAAAVTGCRVPSRIFLDGIGTGWGG